LNRYASESGTPAASKENERPSTADFETSEGKKLKSKLTASGTKAGYKIRAQTSRIVSSFKTQSIVSSLLARDFTGAHSDGVWEVIASASQPLIATASADHLACIWSIDTGRCLLKYEGHGGSVNSIRFHPTKDLLLTASGDNTAHIWLGAVNWESVVASSRRGHSSEEELEDDFEESAHADEREKVETLRTPLTEFSGHSSVVVSADWISSANDSPTQIITASWDRSAILWDIETKASIQTLTGHDNELTHCSANQSNRLVVTSSRDSTFRLWDFRSEIPAVSVFQGHSESVTSTIFTKDDKVISGSDDKSVKIWELRNMRAPLTTIRTDSPVNRLAVSQTGVIAIPHDNRSIRLFDLQGQRIARLQRTSRMGHRRMVSSVAWKENSPSCNLFSSGFDKKVFGWHISV
jgi:WD repeat-containing protein 37